MTTLDCFIRSQSVTKVNFIKCDVEGSELNIWKGGLETLKRFRLVVLTEVIREHLKRCNQAPEDVFDF